MKNKALKRLHKIFRYVFSTKNFYHGIEQCDANCGFWPSFVVDRLGIDPAKGELAFMSTSCLPDLLWINRSRNKVLYIPENIHAKWSYWRIWENCWTWKNAPTLSIGFDYSDHTKYLRFPYWIETIFPPTATYEDIGRFIDKYNYSDSTARNKSCAFVCRKDYYGDRAVIADLVGSILQISYPSDFRHNDDDLHDKYDNNKNAYLRQFRFNLCPENTNNLGYVTEKVFQAIQAGCIPVYWGNEGYPEPDILNPEAIVYIDIYKPSEGLELLKHLNDDPIAYADFISKPRFLPGAEDAIYGYFVRAEQRLRQILQVGNENNLTIQRGA